MSSHRSERKKRGAQRGGMAPHGNSGVSGKRWLRGTLFVLLNHSSGMMCSAVHPEQPVQCVCACGHVCAHVFVCACVCVQESIATLALDRQQWNFILKNPYRRYKFLQQSFL